jgi:protein-S-isoprenylcysteine O-methyltransferase Ste14
MTRVPGGLLKGRKMPAKALWGTLLLTLAYFALALVCLRQWGTPQPWARVDVFSGGFLGLMIFAMILEFRFGLPTLRSPAALRDAVGMAYDTATLVLLPLLSAGDLLVFLDYGHWHLTPALQNAGLQITGLLFDIVGIAWLLWTDAQLTRHFTQDSPRRVLQSGPFRYVRHPRYAAILIIRLAFALVFASAVGWLLAIAWMLVLLRRIRLEEEHLQKHFGSEYDAYAARTPRLIPGVY